MTQNYPSFMKGTHAMSKSLYGVLASSLLLVFGCTKNSSSVGTPAPATFTPTGTVSGVLVDRVTLVPIPNATVMVESLSAVTGSDGTFTITGVPANIPATGSPTSANYYPVVYDLSKVASTLGKYPAIAYDTVMVTYTSLGETASGTGTGSTSGSSVVQTTPVDGFTATMTGLVGKLDANLTIEAFQISNFAPMAGATVNLLPASTASTASIAGSNSTTGSTWNLVATATTDANGLVTFKNIEAGRAFVASGVSSDGAWSGSERVTAPGDSLTTSYTTPYSAYPALALSSVSTTQPFVNAAAPANMASIAPGSTPIVFTFSAAIQATPYALAVTPDLAAGGGLYADVAVNFKGAKSGNIPFTLAWNTGMTQLTVTLTTVAGAAYTVDLTPALTSGFLMDTVNNVAAMGNPILGGTSPFNTVSFTTTGGATPAQPVLTRNPNNQEIITWLPTANTYQYAVVVNKLVGGVPVSSYTSHAGTPYKTTSTTSINLNDLNEGVPNYWYTGFYSGAQAVTYQLAVVAMGTTNVVADGTASATMTLANTYPAPAAPVITQSKVNPGTITWPAVTGAYDYAVLVTQLQAGTWVADNTLAPYHTSTTSVDLASINAAGYFGANGATYTYSVQVIALAVKNAPLTAGTASNILTLASPIGVAAVPVLTRDTRTDAHNTVVYWQTCANAVQYTVVVNQYQGVTFAQAQTMKGITDTQFDLSTVTFPDGSAFAWNNGQIPYTYQVQVMALNSPAEALSAASASNVLAMADVQLPTLTNVTVATSLGPTGKGTYPPAWAFGNQPVAGPGGQVSYYQLTFSFGKTMFRSQLADPTQWTMTQATSSITGGPYVAGGADIAPKIVSIDVSTTPTTSTAVMLLSVTQNAANTGTWDPMNLVFGFNGTSVTGLALNPQYALWDDNARVFFAPTAEISKVVDSGAIPFLTLPAGNQAGPGLANATTTYTLQVSFTKKVNGALLSASMLRASAVSGGGVYVPNGNPALDLSPSVSNSFSSTTNILTVTISYTQNGTATGTWDPQHLYLTVQGNDATTTLPLGLYSNSWDLASGVF